MRKILILLSLAFGLLSLRACGIGSDSNHSRVDAPAPLGLQVALDSGMVLGQEHPESKVWEWLAIPFARPPSGKLRWRAPQAVDAWEGVRDTTIFGKPCPQLTLEGSFIGDENCLHLNVWRPRTQERGLPVYVWVHGGSNKRYSNSMDRFQGDRLAQQSNVVVVSIQFRLGPLGWLFYEPLHNGNPLDDSGKFGLLDIIRSLQWIQNNIEAFGGDAGNVTITGQSSGAGNIMALLLSEQASGLFHKAIIMSTYPLTSTLEESKEVAGKLYDNLTALIGEPLIDPTKEELSEFMYSRSAAELVKSYADLRQAYTADGTVIPLAGSALFATGEHVNKVPIIVGTNRDEFKFYTTIFNLFPDVSDDVRAGIGRYVSDLWRVRGADQFATNITSAPDQPNVYVYRLNWGAPDEEGNSPLPGNFGQILGAHHGLGTTFVLGNWEEWSDPLGTPIFFTEENAAGRKNLSDAIMKYFAAFAYSGNPNGDNLPIWEPFTVEGDFKAIQFDVNLDDSSPKITADSEIYTLEWILSEIDTKLEEPTRSAVLEVLLDPYVLD